MKFKREDIINKIIHLRLVEMASTKTILQNYLQEACGFKQSYSYTLYKEARLKIREIYKKDNETALEEAIGQLEEQAQQATQAGNYKMAFNIRQELNEILGLYKENIEISGDLTLSIPNTIKLIEAVKDDNKPKE